MDKYNLDMMINKIVKNTNSEYLNVKRGGGAAKGTDEWLIIQMKKKVTNDNYLSWLQIMIEGKYKQKKKARKYAKFLLGIDQ